MSQKTECFYFNVKQWLGDDSILLMDWDVRGMHIHLMALAWQQENPGVLENDDQILRRWCGNPTLEDWNKRIKPQILRAWTIKENLLIQDGLVREFERQQSTSEKRRAAINSRWQKENKNSNPTNDEIKLLSLNFISNPYDFSVEFFNGFEIKSIKKDIGIFKDSASQEERATIWNVGVQILGNANFEANQARTFLGKLIKEHGEKNVAAAIAELSIKTIPAADVKSYLIGVLKEMSNKSKSRGKVAL